MKAQNEGERDTEDGRHRERAWLKTKEQFQSFQSNDNDVQGTETINGNFEIALNQPFQQICFQEQFVLLHPAVI